ncbi:MAG: hypothetical protein ABIK89_08220 [Planctomycetota bacterium]
MMRTVISLLAVLGLRAAWEIQPEANGAQAAPKTVPLALKRRGEDGRAVTETVNLDPARTAIVVIDMWDRHWCRTYTARVANMVPRMNETLRAARELGIQVVHAPSGTMEFYADYPQRKAMESIPEQPVPQPIDFSPPEPPGGKDCCECGPLVRRFGARAGRLDPRA